ncbi:nucleoid-associated protein YgaU [Streptacidiphilus sp. MAP12-20]|uniref:LysM peptidoglycan-binding domain-containing protein n=1 Tax=Streptacidiphilus sp. MAP12-20 TaxID=3156299 RepID=UPI003515DAD2
MLRTLIRAIFAFVTLVALLVGLPGVLALGTLAVTRQARPQQDSLVQLLTTPDNGNLFLWALVIVGWVAWLAFAVSVLVEIPAQLRGRMPRRLPTLGWSQRLAGGLVGAVLALLPVAGGALAATGAPAPRLAVSAPLTPAAEAHDDAAATAASADHPGTVTATPTTHADAHGHHRPHYTVRATRPAESLWSIAEHVLGSGERWREIAALNQGRVMDAQQHVFDADRPIEPGWKLALPADAKLPQTPAIAPAAAAATAPATGTGTRQVTVRPGDTLSDIAEREMGSSADWPRLFAANRGVTAPDGHRLTDPNLIEPGMRLTIPGAAAPVPPARQPTPPPTPPQTRPAASTSTPTPTPTPTATPTPTPTPQAGGLAASPPVDNASHHGGSQSLGQFAVAAGTSVLGAVLLGAVALRRSRRRAMPPHQPQHRTSRGPRPEPPAPPSVAAALPSEPLRRTPSHAAPPPTPVAPLPPLAPAPPMPPEPEPVQQSSRDLDLLGRALRSMARNVAREGRRLPPLNVVRVTAAHTIELHLVAPAPPIPPFRAAHASTVWWCTADAPGLLGPEAAAVVPSPYPALVSLGETVDGATVLVDLEAIRLLHISGAPRDIARVLRTLALELTFTPLADRVGVHVVGVAQELAAVADDRLVVHPDLEHAVGALQHRDASVRSALLRANAATPREARSRGIGGEEWAPEVVLCAAYPTGTTPEALGRLLDARPRGSVAVVTAAPPQGTGPVARWTLPASGSGVVPGLEMNIALQKLDDETYDRWLRLLGANVVPPTEQTPTPPPSWPDPTLPDLLTPTAPDTWPPDPYSPRSPEPPTGYPAPTGPWDAPGPADPRFLPDRSGLSAAPPLWPDPAVEPSSGLAPGDPRFLPDRSGASAAAPYGSEAASAGEPTGGQVDPRFLPHRPVPLAGSAGPSGPGDPADAGSGAGDRRFLPRPASASPLPTGEPGGADRWSATGAPTGAGGVPARPAGPTPADPLAAMAPASARPVAGASGTGSGRMSAGRQLTSRQAPVPTPGAVPAPPRPQPQPTPHGSASAPVEYGEPLPQQRLPTDPWILALLATPPGSATPANPQLRIIGPVELVGAAGPVEPERRAALIEAAARRALGPAQGAYVSADAIGRLREWLGDGPEGRPVNLRCDWDDFQALCARGLSDNGASGDTALARALALVRGAPFAEAAYPWAEALRRGITTAVVDVAHELTLRRLRARDHRGGEGAAVRGLVADPDAELLLRDLICLYADSGSGQQLQRTVARLESKAARTGFPLEPESAALLDELRAPADHLLPRR